MLGLLLFLELVLEVAGETADDHVGDQAEDAGDQDGLRLVHVGAAVLVGVGGEGHRGDDQDDQRDARGQHVDLAELGERTLQPGEPLDVAVLEDEVEEDHQQEHATEGGDGRVSVRDQLLVHVLVGHGEIDGLDGPDLGTDRHDDHGEDQAHAEHGDEDTDGEEDLLPEGIHLLQDSGVDHRVVEGQRDLEDGEDRHDPKCGPSPVEHRCGQTERSDCERPAEGFENHWHPIVLYGFTKR